MPFYGALLGPGRWTGAPKSWSIWSPPMPIVRLLHRRNLPGARKAGLTEEELRLSQTGRTRASAPAEQAAILYARELTQTADGRGRRAKRCSSISPTSRSWRSRW